MFNYIKQTTKNEDLLYFTIPVHALKDESMKINNGIKKINEWIKGKERMNQWDEEEGWTDEWTDEMKRMDWWMDGWDEEDRWMDGWMDPPVWHLSPT